MSEIRELEGRVAIVTGAGQSLGRQHALRLAEAGAKIVVNDLGANLGGEGGDGGSLADKVVNEIREAGGEAIANGESVADFAGSGRIVEAALDSFGRIDILVNNAGILRPNLIFDATEEDFDRLFGVHMKGTFNMTRHVAPHFRSQKSGAIVNTGSDSGLGHYGNSLYSAAKEGIAGFTRAIARDLGPYGARCNVVRPAAISRQAEDTKIGGLILEAEQKFGFPSAGDFFVTKMMISEDAAKNMVPHHVSDFVAWLCTDAAAHVNGADFRVMAGEISLMSAPAPIRSVFRGEGRWSFDAINEFTVASYLHKHLSNRFLPQQD